MRYSAWAIVRNALTGNRGWAPVWRDPEPKAAYDVVIIGGGGHGLATAYYLAKNHGITNVAVLERGYLGGGNVGRNTTIVRANYLLKGNGEFYSHSLKLWEGLEQELNYNVMMSQRGVLNLCHSDGQFDAFARRGNAMRMQGDDAELLTRERGAGGVAVPQLRRRALPDPRRPVAAAGGHGAARRGRLGVRPGGGRARGGPDPELRGDRLPHRGRAGCAGWRPRADTSRPGKVGMAVAGRSSQVGAMAGLRLPIESHVLQAFVTEGLKPVLPGVVTFGMGHFYISQSDKGGLVFGGDLDFYNSYAARGNLPTVEHVMEAGMALMPMIGKARVLRSWGGIVDMTMDGSPIIDRTPVEGLFFNGGWCYGGFKATPASGWCFAHLIATGEPHPAAARLGWSGSPPGGCWTRRGPVPSPTCTEPCVSPAWSPRRRPRRRRRRPRCRPTGPPTTVPTAAPPSPPVAARSVALAAGGEREQRGEAGGDGEGRIFALRCGTR